jgi:hypothetical protein
MPNSTWLFLTLIPSVIGLGLFIYGKKQQRWPQLAAGLAFLIDPYLATGTVALVGCGIFIILALWFTIRLGW